MDEADFGDLYRSTRIMVRHANLVVGHLASEIGFESACVRVIEHLSVMVQDASEGGDPEEMALALIVLAWHSKLAIIWFVPDHYK